MCGILDICEHFCYISAGCKPVIKCDKKNYDPNLRHLGKCLKITRNNYFFYLGKGIWTDPRRNRVEEYA